MYAGGAAQIEAARANSSASNMWAPLNNFLGDRRRTVAGLALTSFAGGLAEALFLVVVSRAAFAITDDTGQIDLIREWTLSLNKAILAGLGLILIRCALALWVAAQTSRLCTSVAADTRRTLAQAFLFASWPVQQAGQPRHRCAFPRKVIRQILQRAENITVSSRNRVMIEHEHTKTSQPSVTRKGQHDLVGRRFRIRPGDNIQRDRQILRRPRDRSDHAQQLGRRPRPASRMPAHGQQAT